MCIFESLPPEIITKILLYLSVNELQPLVKVNLLFAVYQYDWDFWADKAVLDLQLPRALFFYTECNFPPKRYLHIQNYVYRLGEKLREAASYGDLHLVKLFIAHGIKEDHFKKRHYSNLRTAFVCAAIHGQRTVVEYMIQQNYHIDESNFSSIPDAIYHAAQANQSQMVDYLLTFMPLCKTAALNGAARGGHLQLVKDMVVVGAINLNDSVIDAAREGHLDVVKYLISKGATNLNTSLHSSCIMGHLEVAKYLISIGADDLKLALAGANQTNKVEVATYLRSLPQLQ